MRILLDCRPLQAEGLDCERSRLIFAGVAAISEGKVEWVLLADRRYGADLMPGLPGRVVFRRAVAGGIVGRFWNDRQLRRLVRREGVDMVWLTGGVAAVGVGVPICYWMPGRAGRRSLRSSLERAAAVLCYSDRDREWLARYLPEVRERVHVLRPAGGEGIGPLLLEDKERVRAKWTQGMDYFLADLTGCGEETSVDLLKAFSLFKKRQQSRMRLVLAGGPEIRERMAERLKTYRYREDVDWAPEAPGGAGLDGAGDGGLGELAGAAYAVLLPGEGNGLGTTLLNMWKAGVPVIAVSGGLWEEMAQGAALGIAAGDPGTLAGQLMRIYKEEDLRAELIRKGFERLKVYSGENFLELLRVITEIAAC